MPNGDNHRNSLQKVPSNDKQLSPTAAHHANFNTCNFSNFERNFRKKVSVIGTRLGKPSFSKSLSCAASTTEKFKC